jgi:hypothetical protein
VLVGRKGEEEKQVEVDSLRLAGLTRTSYRQSEQPSSHHPLNPQLTLPVPVAHFLLPSPPPLPRSLSAMSMLPNSLLPSVSGSKPQYRAVLFAGFGEDLFPLVEPQGDLTSDEEDAKPGLTGRGTGHRKGHGQTKALLPVAGRKMIDWVLERVEEAGVFGALSSSFPSFLGTDLLRPHPDILVLTPLSISKPLAHHLRARRSQPATSGTPSAKVELEEIPEEIATRGCVRVLKWAAEKGLITVRLSFLFLFLLSVFR